MAQSYGGDSGIRQEAKLLIGAFGASFWQGTGTDDSETVKGIRAGRTVK